MAVRLALKAMSHWLEADAPMQITQSLSVSLGLRRIPEWA